jgi:hypothetical protein
VDLCPRKMTKYFWKVLEPLKKKKKAVFCGNNTTRPDERSRSKKPKTEYVAKLFMMLLLY